MPMILNKMKQPKTTPLKTSKTISKPIVKRLDKAIRDKLTERGISREWMKKHLVII